jgi:hypothetical protein
VDERVAIYTPARGSGIKATLLFAGAAGLVLMAVIGFAVSLRIPNDPIRFHAITTLPMICAMWSLGAALAVRRSPREVRVGPAGMSILFGNRARELPWGDVALAPTVDRALGGGKSLKLYGPDGRVLVTLPDALQGFEQLVANVQRRVSAKPHANSDAVATRRLRKRAAGLMVGGVMALALGGVNAWLAYDNARAARLLRESAEPGEATVVRKFVAPDGRTHRIEYRLASINGASLENVEVNPLFWALMSEGQRVPVLYVPSDPRVSRLQIGQIDDAQQLSPPLHYGLSAAIAGLGVVFFAAGLLELRKARRGAVGEPPAS